VWAREVAVGWAGAEIARARIGRKIFMGMVG
jgi:hypothetical protein